MAISLASLRAPSKRPLIITLAGEPGTGKTTLAATFPKPVFIQLEDGMSALTQDASVQDIISGVQEFNVTKSEEVLEAVKVLATEEHDFKTLVIDSVTTLNTWFEQDIIEADPKNPASLNQAGGGYGAGYNMLSDKHRQLREWLGRLSTKCDMHVVMIAHTITETVDSPDSEPFQRTTLALHQKSQKHYLDQADVVAYARLKLFTKSSGNTAKAITSGKRELVCHLVGSCVSKNRLGISEPLPLEIGTNPLAKYL